MAIELTADTRAILEELERQGNLTRESSGFGSRETTNYFLRDSLEILTEISEVLKDQTDVLKSMVTLQEDAVTKQKREEELGEVAGAGQTEKPDRPTPEPNQGRLINERRPSMSGLLVDLKDWFVETLKGSLVLTALGGLAAGIIDGLAGGPFMKEYFNLLGDFISLDFDSVQEKLDSGALDFSDTLKGIAKFGMRFGPDGDINKTITEWKDWITGITKYDLALGIAGVLTGLAAWKVALSLATAALATGLYKTTGIDVRRNPGARKGDAGLEEAKRIQAEQEAEAKRKAEAEKAAKNARNKGSYNLPERVTGQPTGNVMSGRGSYGMDTVEGRNQIRADAAKLGGGNKFKLINNGKGIVKADGSGFASTEEAVKALENSLNPKYSKFFKGITKAFLVAGIAFTAYDAYLIYSILNSDQSDDAKKAQLYPLVGGILGAVGGATLLGFAGSFVGPWGTVIGAGVGGVLGGWFAPDALGKAVVDAFWGESPNKIAKEQAKLLDQAVAAQAQLGQQTAAAERSQMYTPMSAYGGDPTQRSTGPNASVFQELLKGSKGNYVSINGKTVRVNPDGSYTDASVVPLSKTYLDSLMNLDNAGTSTPIIIDNSTAPVTNNITNVGGSSTSTQTFINGGHPGAGTTNSLGLSKSVQGG